MLAVQMHGIVDDHGQGVVADEDTDDENDDDDDDEDDNENDVMITWKLAMPIIIVDDDDGREENDNKHMVDADQDGDDEQD